MRNIKSVLTAILAICLVLCLAVPAFASELDTPSSETVVGTTEGAADGTTEDAGDIDIPLTTEKEDENTTDAPDDTTTTGEGGETETAPDETNGENGEDPAPTTAPTTPATDAAGEAADDHAGHNHEAENVSGEAAKKTTPAWLRVTLTVLEVIASVVLILVVLFQSGKEAGLSGALSGNSDSYLSKSGKTLDKQLASATKWVALVWIVLTLVLCLLP